MCNLLKGIKLFQTGSKKKVNYNEVNISLGFCVVFKEATEDSLYGALQ